MRRDLGAPGTQEGRDAWGLEGMADFDIVFWCSNQHQMHHCTTYGGIPFLSMLASGSSTVVKKCLWMVFVGKSSDSPFLPQDSPRGPVQSHESRYIDKSMPAQVNKFEQSWKCILHILLHHIHHTSSHLHTHISILYICICIYIYMHIYIFVCVGWWFWMSHLPSWFC